jgi:DNA-binding GntR family transcriptional regulator
LVDHHTERCQPNYAAAQEHALTTPERPNKAEEAYDRIEQMITFQELPPNAALSEARLMEITGLGRSPVREALQRLARERMVDIHPSRGVFVTPVSFETQLKLLELRRPVEELADRLAAERADVRQRAEMHKLAADLDEFEGTDLKAFGAHLKHAHHLTVCAAGNEYLSVAMAPLQGLSRRFWFGSLRDPQRELKIAAQLHGDILRAIGDADPTRASQASLALNDYLVEFCYATLKGPIPERHAVPHLNAS